MVRGAAVQFDATWAMTAPCGNLKLYDRHGAADRGAHARQRSCTSYPFVNGWLTAKVLLLVC
jgi:hypothetical protein